MGFRFDDSVAQLTNPGGLAVEPIDPLRLSGASMKGFALVHLLTQLDQANAAWGDEWRALWPQPHRQALARTAVTATTWIPIEYYFHGVGFLAQKMGNYPRAAIEVGFRSTQADIGAFFRFVAAMASPVTVIALAGRFWRSYFDRSSIHATQVTSTGALAEVRDWPLHDDVSPHELAGALMAFCDASRARDIRITRLELTGPGRFIIALQWS